MKRVDDGCCVLIKRNNYKKKSRKIDILMK